MHNYRLLYIDVFEVVYAILHVFDMFGDFTTGPAVQDCMQKGCILQSPYIAASS